MENIIFFVAINIHVVILRIFVKSPEGRFDCDLDLYKANVFASILMFGYIYIYMYVYNYMFAIQTAKSAKRKKSIEKTSSSSNILLIYDYV